MKKAVAIMMAAMMVMSLAACGGSDQAAASTAAQGADTKTEAQAADSAGSEAAAPAGDTAASGSFLEGKTVGFAQTDSMSAWRTTETDDIKKFVEEAGGEFIVKDAGGDISTQ